MQPFSAPSLESMNSLLPGFEFTAMVSSNGIGAVYFARQKSLDRQVAIKLLSPDPGIKAAFEKKARASAGLKHPNIISIFDSGCVKEMPYLVMEFVPGKSLAHSTRGKIVDFAQVMLLMDGICAGMGQAHAQGIVHGCFNSHNVLLNQKAETKIGNFGLPISTRADAADDGTVRFIAPEIVSRPEPASTRSDVYSLGAVLYELVTGRSHGSDVTPPSCISECPPKIDAIWMQATNPDPAKRMVDARAFHDALKEATAVGKSASVVKVAVPAANAQEMAKPTVDSPKAKQPISVSGVGANRKLMRNLVIIAALSYGIYFTWGHLETLRVRRERENHEILARQAVDKERAIAEAKKRHVNDTSKESWSGGIRDLPSGISEEKESTLESLSRLRSRLASGSRIEMPVGTVRKGEYDYLFVSKPMHRLDAAWFAESHGGCLAVPQGEADAGWLLSEVAKNEAAWIGTSEGEPKELPFIIQWHTNGSNPGSLVAQLAITKNSLTGKETVYPSGTVAFGERHYLVVLRPITWEQAADLADQGGGHLMVVSDSSEEKQLGEMTAGVAAENGICLGASLEGDIWCWTTGETWQRASWADDADATDEDDALVVIPGVGWHGRNRADDASGFIIEWSKDAASAGTGEKTASASNEAAQLTKRASELLTTAKQKHSDALAANIKKFNWDLDAYLRGMNNDRDDWAPEIANLKQCVRDDRLVQDQMESGIKYTAEMQRIANYHLQKQTEIDTQLTDGATKIRDAYAAKLKGISESAKMAGQPKLVESIAEVLGSADDLETWIDEMTGDSLDDDE